MLGKELSRVMQGLSRQPFVLLSAGGTTHHPSFLSVVGAAWDDGIEKLSSQFLGSAQDRWIQSCPCCCPALLAPLAHWHDRIAAQDKEQGRDPWAQIIRVWTGLQPRQRRIDVSTRSIRKSRAAAALIARGFLVR